MRSSIEQWPRMRAMYGSAMGFFGGIVATIIAAGSETPNLAGPMLMVAVVSAMTTTVGALAAAAQCWLLYASFIIGHTGQLALTGASGQAAIVLGTTAIVMTALGTVLHRAVRREPVPIPAPRQPVELTDNVKNTNSPR